jgi:hypothetical protein
MSSNKRFRKLERNPVTNEDKVPGFIKLTHHNKPSAEKSSIAYTDYAFVDGDKRLSSPPVRKVEVVAVFTQKDKDWCRVMFEGRKYGIPANRLYKKQERYSPSHTPERIDISRFPREPHQKA